MRSEEFDAIKQCKKGNFAPITYEVTEHLTVRNVIMLYNPQNGEFLAGNGVAVTPTEKSGFTNCYHVILNIGVNEGEPRLSADEKEVYLYGALRTQLSDQLAAQGKVVPEACRAVSIWDKQDNFTDWSINHFLAEIGLKASWFGAKHTPKAYIAAPANQMVIPSDGIICFSDKPGFTLHSNYEQAEKVEQGVDEVEQKLKDLSISIESDLAEVDQIF